MSDARKVAEERYRLEYGENSKGIRSRKIMLGAELVYSFGLADGGMAKYFYELLNNVTAQARKDGRAEGLKEVREKIAYELKTCPSGHRSRHILYADFIDSLLKGGGK